MHRGCEGDPPVGPARPSSHPEGGVRSVMTHTVVAIDLGASSGRVLEGTLEDGVLRVEECSRFPNGPVHVPNAHGDDLVWDVLFLWQGIRNGLTEAARRGPVDAIGIDTWAVDYGLLDRDGRLVGNPAAYRSNRTTQAVAQVYEAVSRAELYGWDGIQFQPFNTVFQLVADRGSAQEGIARQLLLMPDLLGYWLTGRRVCDVTNASTTGLVDPRTRRWSPAVLSLLTDRFGVRVPDLFAPLVEPGRLVGPVSLAEVDLRTHAGEATPLVEVGTHDTASAVVAVPALAGRFGFVSSGTWSLVGMELDHPVLSEASRAANFTNELGVDGTVRYLKNVMGMWVQQECLREWRDQNMTNMAWPTLDAETEASQPLRTLVDINDPRFLAPGHMVERLADVARGAGEPVPRTRAEYLRAITESLVAAYRRALREAQALSGQTLAAVHIVGGGSKNRLLCQLTADATGLPVVAGPVEGTAIGNMLVQLRAVGALSGGLPDLRRVVAASNSTTRYEPRPGVDWDAVERRALGAIPSPAPLSQGD